MKKQENKKGKDIISIIAIAVFFIFLLISFALNYEPGRIIGDNFGFFALDMVKILPPAFILVGLFMVWVDRSTVEKFFGKTSGAKGYIAAILLASTTLYPFIVVLPMAAALSKKGARLSILLTYIGATAICRIPMTIFEASFVGLKFSIIRIAVSIPLIIMSSILIEKMVGKDYLNKHNLKNGIV